MTATDICNKSLTLLGADSISDLTEGSKRGDLCRIHYDHERTSLIQSGYYAFAVKPWVLSSQVYPPPDVDYDYALRLPDEALSLLRVNSNVKWQQSGRIVLTNNPILEVDLTWDVEDTTEFSPMFEDALILSLAKALCIPITENQNLYAQLDQQAREACIRGKGADTAYRHRADRRMSTIRMSRWNAGRGRR